MKRKTSTKKIEIINLFFQASLVTVCLSTGIGFYPALAKSTQPLEIKARTNTKKPSKTANKSPLKKRVKRHIKKSRGNFVPPPPPSIPSVFDNSAMNMGASIAIDYMSLDDLKWKLKSLKKQLSSLELDMKDSLVALAETQKRDKTFEGLFAEGVVSKKELREAKREAKRVSRSVERDKLEIEEVKRVVHAFESRIKVLESSKKTKKRTKKKQRSNKKKKKKK